mgnify:CR=1 FL=1
MKTNYLLSKGYRYFVRLSGAGVPVLSSMVARRVAPRRSNGTWADITDCLKGCCTSTLTSEFTERTILATGPGTLTDLFNITCSTDDVLTFTVIDFWDGDPPTNFFFSDSSGNYEYTGVVYGQFTVIVTDEHGNSLTLTLNIDTSDI